MANDESSSKEVSSKQRALLDELLGSEELKQPERYVFGQILKDKVATSRDASVLISHMLGLLHFRRHFGEE